MTTVAGSKSWFGYAESRSTRWLLPQYLSLDIVLIALSWQGLFARTFASPLRWPVLLSTASAVWTIYIADHLLDSRDESRISNRHRFVRRHRHGLIALSCLLIVASCCSLIWAPLPIIVCGASLALVVTIYAAIVHLAPASWWPKEMVVGVVFALGSSIVAWSVPHPRLCVLFAVFLFAIVCVLNCAGLEFQEWRQYQPIRPPPHRSTAWIGSHLGPLTILLLIGVATFGIATQTTALALAMAVAAILQLLAIEKGRRSNPDTVRAFADASLLTPLAILLVKSLG